MTENSPQVPSPNEEAYKVPIFKSQVMKLSKFGSKSARSLHALSNLANSGKSVRYTSAVKSLLDTTCKCPNVLISDDDPFQLFYYQTLFQRSAVDLGDETIERPPYRLGVYTSGEELIQNYQMIEDCGCCSLSLIITDYRMGPNRMNGVQTVKYLRKLGYNGAIALRTSDVIQDLIRENSDFEELLNSGVLTSYLEKHDHKKIKEIVRESMKGSSSA